MKKFILSLLVSISTFYAFAQVPGAPAGAKMPDMNRGHVFGKVVDDQGKPVEFASVVLLKTVMDPATKKPKDILVKAQAAELNGDFNFKEIPINVKLKIKISFVGFTTYEGAVAFAMPPMGGMKPGQAPDPEMMAKMMAAFEKDLGNIKLAPDSKELDAVVVTGTKSLVEMDIDKKSFNVSQNLVTTGGTAIDVMRNIPSVQVDIDGNVKVRNANPTLFIDGRPTSLTMDQIPADIIDKVEVITNPSAKYDASGSVAGIINIVLKKNKKNGYNGMVNVGANRRGGTNVMGNFSFQQNKWNLTGTLLNNMERNESNGYSDRQSTIGGIPSSIYQESDNKTKGFMLFPRFSADYALSNRSTLTLGAFFGGGGQFKPKETLQITSTVNGLKSFSNRYTESVREFKPQGFQFGFKHTFPKAGEELTMDMNFFGGTNKNESLITTNYLNNNAITGTQIQKNAGEGNNKFITMQTDYVKPIKNEGTIEMGLRAQINELANKNDNTLKAVGSDVYKTIPSASINYSSLNNVYAAYVSVSGKTTAFSYKVGLRGESSNYTGELMTTNQKFSNNYPLSLFPSIFLKKDLSKTDQLQLSVTRRVNRPNFFQLIPFVDYSDSLNITRGNADLVPEFTTSGELSYSKTKGSATFLFSGYYKYTDNLITRYYSQEINPISGRLDLINTFINANSSINYGAELTYTNKFQNWWDFTANVNVYNSKINVSNIESSGAVADGMWTAFGKINNSFVLPKKWVIQLSADYQGKTNMPVSQGQGQMGPPGMQSQSSSQGYVQPYYGIDIAIKKSFLKNDMASLTLAFNDIGKTRGNTRVSFGEGFTQTSYRISNPQQVRLTLSVRFGKFDMSQMKKNNSSNVDMQQMQ
jgi:outer membrane receptor protein involved in Fe transport